MTIANNSGIGGSYEYNPLADNFSPSDGIIGITSSDSVFYPMYGGPDDPLPDFGFEGMVYFNLTSGLIYGPKQGADWPQAFAPAGVSGSNGADGNTILYGSGAPSSGLGIDGNFYINTTAHILYGPKTAGAWGSGTSLVGPAGANGTNGTNGAAGADGNTILYGAGAPASGLGNNGNFYIDTTAHALYGPKTAGAWGGATSLVGPAGSGSAVTTVSTTTTVVSSSTTLATLLSATSVAVGTYLVEFFCLFIPSSTSIGLKLNLVTTADPLNMGRGDVFIAVTMNPVTPMYEYSLVEGTPIGTTYSAGTNSFARFSAILYIDLAGGNINVQFAPSSSGTVQIFDAIMRVTKL